MRKNILAVLILIVVLILTPKLSRAQTFDANKAYLDYQFSLGVYDQANSDFKDAKDFYLTNKTLTLKEDARRKLLAMLKARDQLKIVYMTALRMKILETKGLSESDKNSFFGKIDSEVEWYKNHMRNYKDGDPSEDLFTKSSEAEERDKSTSSPIVYEALFDISLGEETGMRQDHENIYTSLKAIIDEGVKNGKLDMNPFNRWFTDIDLVIGGLKQNEDLSKTQIQKLYGQQNNTSFGPYTEAIETLNSSLKSFSQLNNFLTEVLTSIKNQK